MVNIRFKKTIYFDEIGELMNGIIYIEGGLSTDKLIENQWFENLRFKLKEWE
jgi:hypothetical protein